MTKKKNKWQRKKIKQKSSPLKKLGVSFLLIILIFVAILSVGLAWLSQSLPDPNQLLSREISETTKIYDKTGDNLLYEIFSEQRRTIVQLEEIPQSLIHATIAIEDADFFTHKGFDIKSIIRAVIVDILHGAKVQGASTLTQQFVKNAFLTPKKTFKRKIKELLLAYKIEKNYSKQEILQMYFNEIPYGSNAYGAEAASQIYFNKSVRNLNLNESALLAALTKAPTYYSPYGNHTDELLQRQKMILDIMVKHGFITKNKAEEAKEKNALKNIKPRKMDIIAPHFVMYVKQLLTEKLGQKKVEQGGLKVITSLDLEKQTIAKNAIEKYAQGNEKNYNANNASLVSINPKNGNILAMIGSKDFFDKSIDGQVNVATRNRQPGSSFKPIVYAAALEKGYTPKTLLFDVPTSFGKSGDGKEYKPKNYKDEYFGPVTIKKSLAGSLNIPGVKTLYLVGIQETLNLAKKMGYTTFSDPSRYGLSLVLGGGEVKLLEHVSAFSVFARNGEKIPYKSILKVKDNTGKIIIDNVKEPKGVQVLKKETVKNLNNILSDNEARSFVFGSNNFLTLEKRPVCAKTGTTNEYKDAWTLGYTPNLVTGVWAGNTNNKKMGEGADGSSVAAPIWNLYMKNALKNKPVLKFEKPEPIYVEKPILKGTLPKEKTVTLKIDKISKKLATDLTPESLILEKEFRYFYPILHYLKKDDPQGPAPKNPEKDPQYNLWQKGINQWLKELSQKKEKEIPAHLKGLTLQIPPTEKDDIHTIENMPLVQIQSPKNNKTVLTSKLNLVTKVKAPLEIETIIYKIDDITIKKIKPQKESEIFEFDINLIGLEKGNHEIEVTAYDKVKNKNSDTITISILNSSKKEVIWQNPKNNQEIKLSNFPLNINTIIPISSIEKIRFYNENLDSGKTRLLSTIFNPEAGEEISFYWNMAELGKHKLWAKLFEKNGEVLIGNGIEVQLIP